MTMERLANVEAANRLNEMAHEIDWPTTRGDSTGQPRAIASGSPAKDRSSLANQQQKAAAAVKDDDDDNDVAELCSFERSSHGKAYPRTSHTAFSGTTYSICLVWFTCHITPADAFGNIGTTLRGGDALVIETPRSNKP